MSSVVQKVVRDSVGDRGFVIRNFVWFVKLWIFTCRKMKMNLNILKLREKN